MRDELIVADYAATREALDAIVERLMASEGYQGMFDELPRTRCTPTPRRWRASSRACAREFGGMAGYVRAIGVDDADVERLRARMVER